MSWDKRWVRRSFSAAAGGYDRLAVLQRRIGARLLADLPESMAGGLLVDVGTGTGWCARQLRRRYPDQSLVLIDIAEAMLRQARLRLGCRVGFVAADAESLPLASGCAGLVVSNLALQWCPRPQRAMAEMARILRPGGRLLLTTFAAGTLEELRQAWSQVDDYSHVNEFITQEALEEALAAAGFQRWQVVAETLRCDYAALPDLFRELKGIGAHNVTYNRPRHLLGKGRLQALAVAYPREGGKIFASFVPLYVTAVR